MSERPYWSAEALLPRAELIGWILQCNHHITGVAISGSLARLEEKVHDIDLVVLHDGSLPDRSYSIPVKFSDDLQLEGVIGEELQSRLIQAQDNVPVDYMFVSELALWDCAKLQSLKIVERFPEFYIVVFCQIPLILLNPRERRGGLAQFIEDSTAICPLGGVVLKHRCGNPGCKPSQPWETRREKIARAKEERAARPGY